MSIESRQAKVADCNENWNTLVGLSDQEIKQFVEGGIHFPFSWGQKQEAAAKIVVEKIGIKSAAKKN